MTSPTSWRSAAIVGGILVFAGCAKDPAPSGPPAAPAQPTTSVDAPDAEANDEVAKAIAELPEAERALALAQKYCPVAAMDGRDSLLGSMGMPHKVTLDGKDVYLCCEGCVETAEKDSAATLAKTDELKQRASTELN